MVSSTQILGKHMPVTIKGITPTELVDLLGLPPSAKHWLKTSGAALMVLAQEVRLIAPDKGAHVSVPVKMQYLLALKNKTIPFAVKMELKAQLLQAIEKMKEYMAGVGDVPQAVETKTPPLTTPPAKMQWPSAMELLQEAAAKKKEDEAAGKLPAPAVPDAPEKAHSLGWWPMYDISKLQTGEKMQLCDATHLYQPVRGSSGSSRYFMVAGDDDLRVAARYSSTGSLSIRIEGPHWKKHVVRLNQIGFATNAQEYCSLHLTVTDEVLAAKCLGAVLLGLGLEYKTPLPKLALIKDKGE
jgi:hypothetical protein